MKKKRRFSWGLLVLGFCLTAISGCIPPTGPWDIPSGDGSVVLSFSDARAKTIVPTVSLDIATYDISFTRTGQPTVTLNGVPGATTQTQPVYLKPGPWTVTAKAKNASGDIIGVGTTNVTVNAGHTTTATITILSLVGDGTLTLSATTSELVMSSPSVAGTLTPGTGTSPIALSFTMGSGTAGYSGSVAAGTYLLQLELWDGSVKLASYVDALLIVANFPTSASLAFKPKNGSVIVELVDQLTRAIPITLSGAQSTLRAGSTMTVTATPAVSVDSYQWYLDGEAISGATTNEVTVGSGLDEGEYTLTVVVKKGSVYSSESAGFTVTAAGDIQALSAGSGYTMIVKTDGSLWACGRNNYGQLGDGTNTNRSAPVQVMTGVASVSAGGTHTMILNADGSLWACGYNEYGQLGDGTTTGQSTPVQIMTGVASVSVGIEHTMILKTDGSLWACGWNYYGQLGDGTTTNQSTPVSIMTGVASVSAGAYYTMILKTDGSLWACGANYYGQLGDGTTINRSTPVQVITGVSFVSAGGAHTMIMKTDGTLWAFGFNYYGQLGDGTTTERHSPVQVMTGMASAGYGHTVILKTDGSLWACGFNGTGQLGDGTITNRSTPVQIMTGVSFVSAGGAHTMIMKTDGTLWACGDNLWGELGDGTTTQRQLPVQISF